MEVSELQIRLPPAVRFFNNKNVPGKKPGPAPAAFPGTALRGRGPPGPFQGDKDGLVTSRRDFQNAAWCSDLHHEGLPPHFLRNIPVKPGTSCNAGSFFPDAPGGTEQPVFSSSVYPAEEEMPGDPGQGL